MRKKMHGGVEMKQNLMILGAGVYGAVAREIAESTGLFGEIAFVDDRATHAFDGAPVEGTSRDLVALAVRYPNAVVAIGNSEVRLSLIERLTGAGVRVVSLVSPLAYVSPSATLGAGCVIEPMAVVHAGCELGTGCLVSAGAVVNHASVCGDGVHVDCNATVAGGARVPRGTKIASNTCFS